MKNLSFIFSLLIILCLSCSQKDSSSENQLPDYEFVITDSLQIDHLEALTLLDIHEDKELFLLTSQNSNSLFLANKSGEIIATFEEPGDAPTAFGNNTGSGVFLDNQIVIMGRTRFAVYDLDFNFQHGFKLPSPPSGMFYLGFDHLQPVTANETNKLVAFTGGPQTETPSNQPQYYQEYNTFDLIDPDSGTFTPIVPFHPQSRFLSGEAFNFVAPIFQTRGNEISFVHKRDTLLYTYIVDQPDSFTATRIPFDKFIMNKGFPMSGEPDYTTPKAREGEIYSYLKMEDLNLFIYQSGITLEDMPDRSLDDETLWKEFDRLNPMKWVVMDATGNISYPKPQPEQVYLSSARMDSEGNLWAGQNIYILDEEPDLITFYKLKLVQK